MPDLGRYAFHVLAAYGVTLALIAALVGLTAWQSRRVRMRLERIEGEAHHG